jgi:hypothetical protein
MKYRKKPVVIEAVQFLPGNQEAEAVLLAHLEGCVGWQAVNHPGDTGPALVIPTFEGKLYAAPGDWIIKGVRGEFYPCKPDIFALTYEPADESVAV